MTQDKQGTAEWVGAVEGILLNGDLTPTEKVLTMVLAFDGGPMSPEALAKPTGLTTTQVHYHLRRLVQEEAVFVQAVPDYERQVFVKTYCLECRPTDMLGDDIPDTLPTDKIKDTPEALAEPQPEA